jgi:O-antigen ligase
LYKIKTKLLIFFFGLASIIVFCGYFNYSAPTDAIIVEQFILIFLSLLLVLYFTINKALVKFNYIDFLLLFFCVTAILGSYTASDSIGFLLFCFMFYFWGKSFFASFIFEDNNTEYLLKIYLVVFIGFISYWLYKCFILSETLVTLYNPNISIFSNLLASLLVFAFGLFSTIKSNKKSLSILLFIVMLALLILTKGRAGWVGFLCSTIFIGYKIAISKKVKKKILLFGVLIFIPLLLAFYFYKSDSSQGRLLIYKVSFSMLKENWLLGIGHGQFKVQYNLAQSHYFSMHSIDNKEALLADNTIYAFNDFFQVVIEHGLLGLFFVLTFAFLIVGQLKKVQINEQAQPLFIAAQASLLCIFITSLFSYSLQIFPIIFQATVCLTIIFSFPTKENRHFVFAILPNKMVKIICVIFSLLLCIHFGHSSFYHLKSNEAYELKKIGFKSNSMLQYQNLSNAYLQDGNTLFQYGEGLYFLNELEESKKV